VLLWCCCCCLQVTFLLLLVALVILTTNVREAAAVSGGVHSVGAPRKLQLAQEVKYYDKAKCTNTAVNDFEKKVYACNRAVAGKDTRGQVACCPSGNGKCYADTSCGFDCKKGDDASWCCWA
jgi:hypothetical protein